MYNKSLHIFRRDFRLEDNTALIQALHQSKTVIPCFILDQRQIDKSPFAGQHFLQFMSESLHDLNEQLRAKGSRLYLFQGKAEDVVEDLIKKEHIDAVFFNADYTPFARKRDKTIEEKAEKHKCNVHIFHDVLLTFPGQVLKDNGTPYTVFTPFFRRARLLPIPKPMKNKGNNYEKRKINGEISISELKNIVKEKNNNLLTNGGRAKALKLLKNTTNLTNYDKERDIPSMSGTSLLSAHHKCGTLSIRETYHHVAKHFSPSHTIIQELYWRDFFTHIGFHFPHVFTGCFHKKYDKIKWANDKKLFAAWCQGKTGFPIVDAGMRELNTTGYMHNRVRMITASFLVKDLHIDWHWGEQYFAKKLIDYDPAVNNGNWQWAASTGCDAQPYFRIFNPWRQQERFDQECAYIKKWIPELKNLSSKEIHNLLIQRPLTPVPYPLPIIDHKAQADHAKAMYKNIT